MKHEYGFDIKMFAIVRIIAASQVEAERTLALALDRARLIIDSDDSNLITAVVDPLIEVDDVAGPLLFEVDGQDVG